jgi:hypothetical protein
MMNDGKPDSVLYRKPDYVMNDKWSLETDTASFFLTVNPTVVISDWLTAANKSSFSASARARILFPTVGKYYKDKLNTGYADWLENMFTHLPTIEGEGWTSFDLGTGLTKTEELPYLSTYTGAGAPFRY